MKFKILIFSFCFIPFEFALSNQVEGSMIEKVKELMQRMDKAEEQVKSLTERLDKKIYVLEVSSDKQGTSVPLDRELFSRLCEDDNGCLITLGMGNWKEDKPKQIATVGPYELNYSSSTKEWRRSEYHNHPNRVRKSIISARTGKDGNNQTEHALIAWNKCYLTDGVYIDYKTTDTESSGFSLLYSRNATYNNPNIVCRVIIRD